MKKKGNIAVIIIFIVFSLFAVMAGLYALDSLPQKLSYKISSLFSKTDVPVNNEVITDVDNETNQTGDRKIKTLPSDMHGVWIDLDTDIMSDPAEGANPFLIEAEDYFNYFKNFLTDTVFIKPDTEKKYGELYDSYGNSADLLREYIYRADQKEYFKILVVDDKMMTGKNGKFNFDTCSYYLNNYMFDAVVLEPKELITDAQLSEAAAYLHENVKKLNAELFFGLIITPDAEAEYADAQTIDVLNAAILDFAVVSANGSLNTAVLPFTSFMPWFNEAAACYPSTSFYALHRTDLVCSGTPGWGSAYEIADEMKYMWDLENFRGSVFYNASSLKRNRESFAVRIAYLLDDGEVKDLSIKNIALDPTANTVTFSGTSLPGHKLLCNSKIAMAAGGEFLLRYPLSAGENEFDFFSCGKTVTYNIYNNSHLVYSYYPQEDINAAKDDTITVSAVCMNNCTVVCSLDGKDYPMILSGSEGYDSIPEGFSVFSCNINFTTAAYSDLNLGNIEIKASLGEAIENVTACRVTLLKSNSSEFINGILGFTYKFLYGNHNNSQPDNKTENDAAHRISPYNDNGLGTSLMCKVLYDDTEQVAPVGVYDTYQPDLSSLCEGTLDYVDRITVSEDGYIRYELRSGISVYGVNCELINNAYTMPANNISVFKVAEEASSTDIIMNTDWLVPVTVKSQPQSFHKGYLDFSFNLYDYTAEYIDITFYNTGAFYGSELLNFAQESPFLRYELYSGEKGEIILRLHLKNKGQFYGFDIYTDDNSRLVLSFKKHATGDLAGKVVMLDPGHGGLAMTGTALRDESVPEARITLSIASKLRQMLADRGAVVLMTRTMDTALELDERCKILSENDPDIYVSIHCDGSDNEPDCGTHTFYFRSYSQPLAQSIHASLVSVYQNYIYSPGDTNYSSINRSIKFYPFYVTRCNQCPSVLVETGFMTNITEGNILANDNCQYWIAQGICDGIQNYFQNNNSTVIK